MGKVRSFLNRHPRARDAAFVAQNLRELLRPATVTVSSETSPRYFLTAMVRVKNEARFLPEWLAYNSSLGIQHFYVYDNGSTDDTYEVLKPFVDAGLVTYTSWPSSPIYPASDYHFYSTHGTESQWVAFFDPDEFLIENRPGALVDILRESSRRPALAVNWRYFGSSHHDKLPKGFIVENFRWADEHANSHVKTIVQPREVRRLRNPHNAYFRRGRLARTASGARAFGSFAQTSPEKSSQLTLNHYVYRSREDYTRKATQGFADKKRPGEAPRHLSRIETEFPKHNQVLTSPPAELAQQARSLLRSLHVGEEFWSEGVA